MSSLQPSAGEITFYTYDLIRDESGLPIRKIYLQRIIHEHSVTIKQLPKVLTPQNKDLFSRPICFLKKADIASLPAIFQTNGWSRFFEAMYFAVPSKNCPTSMDADEKDSKTHDLEDTIRILTDLTTNTLSSTDPNLLPIVHKTLGIFYFKALGVKSDHERAFSHFQFAADHGLVEAHVFLGTFFGNGLSVPKNLTAAISHFKIAAKMGSIEALYQLANLLALDENKIEDSTPYFNEAADKGHPIALFWVGYLQAEQAKLPSTPKKLKKTLEQNAVMLYKKAAALDCVTAQLALGQAYTFGYLGLPKRTSDAIKYLTFAAQNRSAEGASNLGVIYASSGDYKSTQYAMGFTSLLKACRYSYSYLKDSVGNINKLLQDLANNTSPEAQQLKGQLSAQANAYFIKHNIAISRERKTTILPQYNNAENESDEPLTPEKTEENYRIFIAYGQTLRQIHVKTLSPDLEKLFLDEEAARPERTKQLIEHFLPTLNHFTNLYIDYINMHGSDNESIEFIDFLQSTKSQLTEDAQIFLLSRLYLLNARDIMYLYKIIKKQYFFDHLVSSIPFYRWEIRQNIENAQMMLLNFYLRILAEDFDQIGKLMYDPITSLNHLNEACYWDMCHLINTTNMHNQELNILANLMTITMTYHMTRKSLDAETINKIKKSLITQITQLPELRDNEIAEFDSALSKYKDYAPIVLENLKKIGILEIPNTVVMGTKILKHHSQVNEYKNKSAAIGAFFTERYAHFHADRIEAERKAKEDGQMQRFTEQSQKEIALRAALKEQTIKTQSDILKKMREQISSNEHGISKALTLQEQFERLESLHQQTLTHQTFSQKLKDKFTKTHRSIQTLLASSTTSPPSSPPIIHQTLEPLLSSSPEKVNLRAEIIQQLEARETLKAQKESEIKAKKEERAQARAAKKSDYEEAHSPILIEPIEAPVQQVPILDTIDSFQDKVTEAIFTTQSDQHAGNAVFLLNLINRSKSLIDIRSQITHGQNLEPLIGQSLRLQNIKSPLQHYSLRVNDQYRITFYWDKTTKKAYHVWFGDYHL